MRAAVELLNDTRRDAFGEGVGFDLGIQAEPIYVGDPSWDTGPITLTGEPEKIAARLTKYAGVGANHLQLRFAARSANETAEQIERFGAEVWPLVQPPA
jgi:hypothetical protein